MELASYQEVSEDSMRALNRLQRHWVANKITVNNAHGISFNMRTNIDHVFSLRSIAVLPPKFKNVILVLITPELLNVSLSSADENINWKKFHVYQIELRK